MADTDELKTGDIVLVEYTSDSEVEPMYLGRVESFDEMGVEVSSVYRINEDDVLNGWKVEGWSIEKVGVEYDEDRDAIRTGSDEWTAVDELF